MINKNKWIYGELVRNRWGVNERTLEVIVYNEKLPVYDENNERIDDPIGNCPDTYKFILKDIEQFELKNEHLFKLNTSHGELKMDAKGNRGLGKRITVKEVAELLGIDQKTVRENYDQLGGMRLGRLYLFFERSVINAIQKETEMDSPSAEGWEETGKSISSEEGGSGVGSQDAPKTRQRMEQEDRHGLFE